MQNPGVWIRQDSSLIAKKPSSEIPLIPPSHPLQARNPQQPQAKLEGVDAEAAVGQEGGAGNLKHGLTDDEAYGPQGYATPML